MAGAGAVVGLINAVALIANIAVFLAGHRAGAPRHLVVAASTLIAMGTALIAFTSATIAGVIVTSLGFGIIFPTLFALVLLVARDQAEASSISARMNSVGFVIAALAPLALGATRDWSGSYALPLLELVALSAVLLGAAALLVRDGSGDAPAAT